MLLLPSVRPCLNEPPLIVWSWSKIPQSGFHLPRGWEDYRLKHHFSYGSIAYGTNPRAPQTVSLSSWLSSSRSWRHHRVAQKFSTGVFFGYFEPVVVQEAFAKIASETVSLSCESETTWKMTRLVDLQWESQTDVTMLIYLMLYFASGSIDKVPKQSSVCDWSHPAWHSSGRTLVSFCRLSQHDTRNCPMWVARCSPRSLHVDFSRCSRPHWGAVTPPVDGENLLVLGQ